MVWWTNKVVLNEEKVVEEYQEGGEGRGYVTVLWGANAETAKLIACSNSQAPILQATFT
jgi:hypothetical protein